MLRTGKYIQIKEGRKNSRNSGLDLLIDRLEGLAAAAHCDNGQSLIAPYSIHDQDGTMLHASNRACELIGQPETANGGFRLIDAVHVQDRVGVAQLLAGQAGEASGTIEFRPSRQSLSRETEGTGGILRPASWLEMSCYTVHSAGETFIVATYRDISSRKHLEIELMDARGKADELDIAKTQFFANVSHELRTPLNAIMGFSELLNSPIGDTIGREKRIEYSDLIHDSAKHLLSVLNSILDVSKIDSGMYEVIPELFDVGECVTNTVAMMKGQAEMRRVRLTCHGLQDMPEIVADQRAIRQVMINLVSNAIKFSDENSEVTVSASRMARSIRLLVTDQGIGISPEHIESLGKPFFQADSKHDRTYEGTGLGLSVVKRLLELHHGTMKVESTRGEGTTVVVNLPIHGAFGRNRPAIAPVEKITRIEAAQNDDKPLVRIIRNTA